MSDTAEEPQPPPEDSATNEEKKKSKRAHYIINCVQVSANIHFFRTLDNAITNVSGCAT